VLRRTQNLIDCAAFDDATEVHHRHLMRQILDDGEVVRDEEVSQPEIVLQTLEQIEDLRLYRNVERRGRFVADDQLRLYGQCAGNGDALPLL